MIWRDAPEPAFTIVGDNAMVTDKPENFLQSGSDEGFTAMVEAWWCWHNVKVPAHQDPDNYLDQERKRQQRYKGDDPGGFLQEDGINHHRPLYDRKVIFHFLLLFIELEESRAGAFSAGTLVISTKDSVFRSSAR